MQCAESQAPPAIASIDDIDREFASRAYSGTSMSPERRGEQARKDYADSVNALYAKLWPLATTDEQRELLAGEMERYREGYLKRMRAYLSSHSSVMSTLITGPANFPVARNQKRGQAADNKLKELAEWEAKARASINAKLKDSRSDDEKADDEWKGLSRRITSSLATIHEIDTVGSPYSRALFVNSIAGRVERLAYAGEVDLTKRALALIHAYNERNAKPAISPRHKFWGFEDVANAVAAKSAVAVSSDPQVVASGPGMEIVANPQLDRVQILFDKKPDPPLIAKLKGEGWRWAPSEGAWQRKLTEAAKHSAKRIVGL